MTKEQERERHYGGDILLRTVQHYFPNKKLKGVFWYEDYAEVYGELESGEVFLLLDAGDRSLFSRD